jgi:PKD domain
MSEDRSRHRLSGLVAAGAALAVLALPGTASATTYCSGGFNLNRPCDANLPTLQAALDAASLHAGADVVRLGFGEFSSPGFVYDDRGSATNGVTIEGTIFCEAHTACGQTQLEGAGTGGRQLSFTGAGGAPVTVSRIQVQVGGGAVGLELPAGGRATEVYIETLADGATGVRLAGAGALLEQSVIALHPGGATDTGVDAAAASVVHRVTVYADVGIRSESAGLLQVTGGEFNTHTGIRANHARIAGAVLDGSQGPGVEAVCPDPTAPDADVSVTNATVRGTGAASSVGVRALASDGGGQSCAAGLDLNSSTITGVATSLLVHGEGAGAGHVDARYSNFEPAKVVTEGPATVNTSSPGGNLNVDPAFIHSQPGLPPPVAALWVTPRWGSQLIDRGDPAAPEPWQQGVLKVVHGRRDIGAVEYGFNVPFAFPAVSNKKVGPRVPVEFSTNAHDLDIDDPLTTSWLFDDGTTATASGVSFVQAHATRAFKRIGRQGGTLTVVDGSGQKASVRADVDVVRPQIQSLGLSRSRIRGRKRVRASCALDVPARVVFTVQRRVHRHHRSLWKRVPGHRTVIADQSIPDAWARIRVGRRWGERRLRPGLFRLTASPTGGKAAHVRFRVLS